MSDLVIEHRPVAGYAARVGRKPRLYRSMQQRCVDLLQADGPSADERAFVRDAGRLLLAGQKLRSDQSAWLLKLWTDYCRWGAP